MARGSKVTTKISLLAYAEISILDIWFILILYQGEPLYNFSWIFSWYSDILVTLTMSISVKLSKNLAAIGSAVWRLYFWISHWGGSPLTDKTRNTNNNNSWSGDVDRFELYSY